jgi:hypothetical protein
MSTVDAGLADLRRAFAAVFAPVKAPRMFGAATRRHQGFSDDNDGVQWNAGVDRHRGVVTVGVNLEGMAYSGWPIARFLEAEQRAARFPAFAGTYAHADAAELWFSRDAWQAASRFDIKEQHFGPEPPVYLRDVTDALWQAMLREAYDCLDASKHHRGRATQTVTLRTGQREMTVSPHIQVKLVVRREVDMRGLDEALRTAKQELQPVRELIQRQSGA